LLNNDGGKNLAGMTALGQMLKNLKTSNNTPNYEKIEERIKSMESLVS